MTKSAVQATSLNTGESISDREADMDRIWVNGKQITLEEIPNYPIENPRAVKILREAPEKKKDEKGA